MDVKAEILRGKMAVGEGRCGTNGTGTGGNGEVKFAKRERIEEAGDEDTRRGGATTLE